MNRMDRLRQYAQKLRKGPPGESRSARADREGKLYEANRILDDFDRAKIREEAMNDPAVVEFHRRRLGNKLTEAEVRAKLRREVAEPVEQHPNPAAAALATTAEQRVRAAAWGDNEPQEGWLG